MTTLDPKRASQMILKKMMSLKNWMTYLNKSKFSLLVVKSNNTARHKSLLLSYFIASCLVELCLTSFASADYIKDLQATSEKTLPRLVEARALHEKGDYEKACKLPDLSKSLKRNRMEVSEYFFIRGYACDKNGDSKKALENFARSISYRKSNSDSLVKLAELSFQNSKEKATQYLNDAIWFSNFSYLKKEEALLTSAKISLAENDLEKSEKLLRESLAINPQDQETKFLLAGVLDKKGIYDEALSLLGDTTSASSEEKLLAADILLKKPKKGLLDSNANQAGQILAGLSDNDKNSEKALELFVKQKLRLQSNSEALDFTNKGLSLYPNSIFFQDQKRSLEGLLSENAENNNLDSAGK